MKSNLLKPILLGLLIIITVLSFGYGPRTKVSTPRMPFFPAIKDDRTVSQYVTLEYNFNVY